MERGRFSRGEEGEDRTDGQIVKRKRGSAADGGGRWRRGNCMRRTEFGGCAGRGEDREMGKLWRRKGYLPGRGD